MTFSPIFAMALLSLVAAGTGQRGHASVGSIVGPYLKCGEYFVYENSAFARAVANLNAGMDAYTFSKKHPSEVMSRNVSNMGETAAIQFYQQREVYRQIRSVRLAGPAAYSTTHLKPLRYEEVYAGMIAGSLLGYPACRPSP